MGMLQPCKSKGFRLWATGVAVFVLAFGIGWFSRTRLYGGNFVPTDPALRASGNYKYINPLLACGTWENKDFDEYALFKNRVAKFVGDVTESGAADIVGVYFRDLLGPRWFGINENVKFSPASLLKVPIMIAYLKSAEKNSEILNKTIYYDGNLDLNKNERFRSPYGIAAEKSYKVDDLLTAMIVNSDNNATMLLDDNINKASLTEVFTDLGLSIPSDDSSNSASADFISPKSFSYFFRVLYNATYLNNDFSEKALSLLAGPDFPQGIQAGLPIAVLAAQKFGERSVFSTTGKFQYEELHDCGIVYYPARPYLLCVMTKGKSFDSLVSVIQNISKIIYTAIAKGS